MRKEEGAMTTTTHKKWSDIITEVFGKVAFAEAGELYPEHHHKLRKVSEVFAEVAFAESGEEYRIRPEQTRPPKVCVNGETSSGMCV